jgi:hypothetical protein
MTDNEIMHVGVIAARRSALSPLSKLLASWLKYTMTSIWPKTWSVIQRFPSGPAAMTSRMPCGMAKP